MFLGITLKYVHKIVDGCFAGQDESCNGGGVCISSLNGTGVCNCFSDLGYGGDFCGSCLPSFTRVGNSCVRKSSIEALVALARPEPTPPNWIEANWQLVAFGTTGVLGTCCFICLFAFACRHCKTPLALKRRHSDDSTADQLVFGDDVFGQLRVRSHFVYSHRQLMAHKLCSLPVSIIAPLIVLADLYCDALNFCFSIRVTAVWEMIRSCCK